MLKKETYSIRRNQISNRERIAKASPFYNVHSDAFYHGPAWVIKPRLFQPKENEIEKPGPGYYHIPERSVYVRPGQTIGSRYETSPPASTHLLAHYHPHDHYLSSAQMPDISITPRRTERKQRYTYSGRFYFPSNLTHHRRAPLLRPLYKPMISRKSLDHNSSSVSPGPAAYPMHESDEDILPRPQPGFTQKHRFPSDRKVAALQTNPPFYYPYKADRHRLPSFTMGKRWSTYKKLHPYVTPYYTPLDEKALCSRAVQPGVTLKGRWSPAVYMERPTLHETLKVHKTAPDIFTQPAESLFVYPYRTSVFGGQIIGSAIYAAQQTLIKDYPLHSLHSYFLAAADNSTAILYTVKRLRDGKSFETRSVTARQDDKIIFECAMSFHRKEQGHIEHQPVMPDVGVVPPEQLHSTRYRFQNLLNDKRLKPELRPFVELALDMPARIDIRHCQPRDLLRPAPEWPARQLVWIKAVDPLPDDSHLHRSAVAYCSDRVLLTSTLLPYALNIFSPHIKMQASLDHAMWFHDDFNFDPTPQISQSTEGDLSKPIRRSADIPSVPLKLPVRADDWLLYELECPIATNNRALTFGRIWTRNGRLVVTCVQEGVIRCY